MVEYAAVGEVCTLSLVPTAEAFDADKVHVRVEFLVLCENFLVRRAIMILRSNVLAFVGVEVVQIFSGKFAGAALVTTLSTMATEGSAKMLMLGITIS